MTENAPRNTTLCYLEQDGRYLMLHRVKKEHDENRDKWIGVGGKFEPGESPEDCALREVREETGLTLTDWDYRGIVTFRPSIPVAETNERSGTALVRPRGSKSAICH